MFSWSTQTYIDKVENGSDAGLLEYQKAELKFVKDSVVSPSTKTFIDVGAGYGRVVSKIASSAKAVVGVEIDKDLLAELRRRADKLGNVEIIDGSGDELTKLLPPKIKQPVLLSMQNTIGPWEGDRNTAIEQLKLIAERNSGEIIISLFCREAIRDWGIPMYASIKDLLGNYDSDKSDLDKGIFVTDANYESYWLSKAEREEIKSKLGGKLMHELEDHKYHIFHISCT